MTINKTYSVVKYFDDHLEQVISSGLTIKEAETLRDDMNEKFKDRTYTSYEIRED